MLHVDQNAPVSFEMFMAMVDAGSREYALEETQAGLAEHRQYNVEYWMTLPDNARIYVRGSGEMCQLGGLDVVVGVVIDITKHYATKERLNALREILKEINQ